VGGLHQKYLTENKEKLLRVSYRVRRLFSLSSEATAEGKFGRVRGAVLGIYTLKR